MYKNHTIPILLKVLSEVWIYEIYTMITRKESNLYKHLCTIMSINSNTSAKSVIVYSSASY